MIDEKNQAIRYMISTLPGQSGNSVLLVESNP